MTDLSTEDRTYLDGLHLFTRGARVYRADELQYGVVEARIGTLQARVRWEDGTLETIEQGDPAVFVTNY